MLKILIKAKECWDSKNERFIHTNSQELCLEHSLVSLSKWESKYKKPFLSNDKNSVKTEAEIIDYIKYMTITQNVDDSLYYNLSKDELEQINSYISDSMTATWFRENATTKGPNGRKANREQITSELIYYWMFSYGIPISCEKWHLNRLLTLIRIFNIKESEQNGKGNKMSKRDILSQNRALNAARRKSLGSKG